MEMLGLIWPGAVCDETIQDNNMTDHTGAIYAENDNELLWPIRPNAVYNGNQIGQ